MYKLTHLRALLNSAELVHVSNPHRYRKTLHLPAVGLLFQQKSGELLQRTRTLTQNHTVRQFTVPSILHCQSTATVRHRYSASINPDSDSHNQVSEINTGIASNNSDRSAAADDERHRNANVNEAEGEQWTLVLPEELSRNVVTLSCESSAEGGICDVYLVGTTHVSLESCKEVEAVISHLQPQVLFLELCPDRADVLSSPNTKVWVPTMGEMLEMWKKNEKNIFGILLGWHHAKVASRLDDFYGDPFRAAYEEAGKYGSTVVLGDRPIEITLRRTWSKMPLWHKTKWVYYLMSRSLFLPSPLRLNEKLKESDTDTDTDTKEISKSFPTVVETLLHERDQYMSYTLLKVARKHSSVVAVVGKGHLQGIKKLWEEYVDVSRDDNGFPIGWRSTRSDLLKTDMDDPSDLMYMNMDDDYLSESDVDYDISGSDSDSDDQERREVWKYIAREKHRFK